MAMMAQFLTPIGLLCAIVGFCIILSLATGKTINIGRSSPGSSIKRLCERNLEPTEYWMAVAGLCLLFGALLFGTLSGFTDR